MWGVLDRFLRFLGRQWKRFESKYVRGTKGSSSCSYVAVGKIKGEAIRASKQYTLEKAKLAFSQNLKDIGLRKKESPILYFEEWYSSPIFWAGSPGPTQPSGYVREIKGELVKISNQERMELLERAS